MGEFFLLFFKGILLLEHLGRRKTPNRASDCNFEELSFRAVFAGFQFGTHLDHVVFADLRLVNLHARSCTHILWFLGAAELVDSVFFCEEGVTLQCIVEEDVGLVLKLETPCAVVVSFKEHDLLIACILFVNVLCVMWRYKVVALAVTEERRNETLLDIVNRIQIVN